MKTLRLRSLLEGSMLIGREVKEAKAMQYVAIDGHRRYSLVSVESVDGELVTERRVDHEHGAITDFLSECERGSPVAVETIGNWYWIVDEIESAGMKAQLVHARRAKMMLASTNKTDRLDCRGMNRLQRTGTLPVVWIPPGNLRDRRDLLRTRMVFVQERTRLKNRIHSMLAKYGIRVEGVSDLFGRRGREQLGAALHLLPEHGRFSTERLLGQLDSVDAELKEFEDRLESVLEGDDRYALLLSIPGVGFILAAVILFEVGEVDRFASAAHLASYSGTTPRVHASGGKVRYGNLRADVNRYLKWAFCEAATTAATGRGSHRHQHIKRLYSRLRERRGQQKAIGAVARHLAEATYWILKKEEPYREPKTVSSTGR
jgi:transposase